MEKIDLRFNGAIARDSPDIKKMVKHRTDERTIFYFQSEEKKQKFIERYKKGGHK